MPLPLKSTQRRDDAAQVFRPAVSRTNANTRLHADVAKSFLTIHLFMFAVLTATFAQDGETLFMIAICAVYFAM